MSGTSKRAAGDGTVFQAADGAWIAMLELPRRPDGSRHRKKRRAKTKAEASRLLRQMKAELDANGRLPDGQRKLITTLEDYYTNVRASAGIADSTLERERWLLDLVVDYFGDRRTSASLSVADCDDFFRAVSVGLKRPNGQRRRPVAKEQVGRLRSTLVAAIRNDVRLGLLVTNVAELAVLPAETVGHRQRRALSAEELALLHRAATGATAVLITLIGRLGLRPAEARAVRWANLEMGDRTLSVAGQLNKQLAIVGPKTKKATRTIRFDTSAADELIAWREAQFERQLRGGPAWTDLGIVATTDLGTPIDRNNFRRSIHNLCTVCGISPAIAPYELRHTAITLQIERGFSAWQVADWAGTSERMIYETYRHKLSEVIDLPPVIQVEKQDGAATEHRTT